MPTSTAKVATNRILSWAFAASSFVVISVALFTWTPVCEAGEKPNFIVVFCDDLGYADIGPFGSQTHATPVLDQMAKEGMRLTDFYSTCSVCTPSRSSLMTGCYPRRVNMHVDEKNLCVLFPAARKGLNPSEVTVAEVLKQQGYATMCIGKWHLGDHPDFLPTSQGFDSYFGIPYSNDMNRKQVPLPLVRNETVIADSVQNDTTITKQYTDEAVKFIMANKSQLRFFPLLATHRRSSAARAGQRIQRHEQRWSVRRLGSGNRLVDGRNLQNPQGRGHR